MIFVNSMSDLFHDSVPVEFIQRVFDAMALAHWHTFQVLTKRAKRVAELANSISWPSNVWQGVSVENANYTWRIDHLRRVPSEVRFLSVEPLLGPITNLPLKGIDWVIVGGESGPGNRPPDGNWIRQIRDQCLEAKVPFFFKQWGGRTPKSGGRLLDGRFWDQIPMPRSSNSRRNASQSRNATLKSSDQSSVPLDGSKDYRKASLQQ
jgi:protein gp37